MTPQERFAALVASKDPSLAEGCFLIEEHLGKSLPGESARLDALADAIGGTDSLDDIASHVLTVERFRGDRNRYYDERNSLLGEVLRRRIGIPITLAVVVIEVAERCGVAATGVGMPGHFLVGDGATPTRWLDCFDGNTWLDQAGARARFHGIHGPDATFDPAYLQPTPKPQILARVLGNLGGVYRSEGNRSALCRVLELRAEIAGAANSPRAQVELAEARAGVGRIAEAIAGLERLGEQVEPRRRDVLDQRIAMLRALLN